MKIHISEKTSVAVGKFGPAAAAISLRLEGRKTWLAHDRLRFETSRNNLDLLHSYFPSREAVDARSSLDGDKWPLESETLPTAPEFVLPPRNFQLENFHRFKDQPQWAIFSEQGTGKTKVALDIISHRYLNRTITGVIVLSSPKGVHAQWIEDQLPKHLWARIKFLSWIWDSKKAPLWFGKPSPELQIVSGNIDMVKGGGAVFLKQFAAQHGRKLLVLLDESDSIKNLRSQRSKKIRELAKGTNQRGIMTGTPIAKDLTDEWSQFYFLNPDIIGHKYVTSFRSQFCLMGGFQNKAVVGHRNMEQFKRLTAPYIFRATKADLDLPDKIYDSVVFDLGATQKRLIRELRDQFFSSIGNGETVAVRNGISAMLRIQQISNGFVVDENGVMSRLENPRLEAAVGLRANISGPVILWCRFKEDVKILKSAFPHAVTIFGDNDQTERATAKTAFLGGKATELIATPGAAGRGVDGLQAACESAIYYSNSYNAIDRWQSEDRIHRIGMTSASYFDLIARGSIDRAILANLQKKHDIASLALSDIKQILGEVT